MTTRSKLVAVLIATACIVAAGPSPAGACDETAELEVKELKLARDVQKRRPLRTGDAIAADGERIYAYLRLGNLGDATQVRVVWLRGTKIYHRTLLKVGQSPSWRTWAYIRASKRLLGDWQVRVESLEGDELAHKRFVIASK